MQFFALTYHEFATAVLLSHQFRNTFVHYLQYRQQNYCSLHNKQPTQSPVKHQKVHRFLLCVFSTGIAPQNFPPQTPHHTIISNSPLHCRQCWWISPHHHAVNSAPDTSVGTSWIAMRCGIAHSLCCSFSTGFVCLKNRLGFSHPCVFGIRPRFLSSHRDRQNCRCLCCTAGRCKSS